MSGPEHYLEAERLIREANNDGGSSACALAAAQVHATLALVVASRNARNPQTYPEHTRFGGVA